MLPHLAYWILVLAPALKEGSANAGVIFKAMLIGLSIAAPAGPIGLLCIQRTLAHGAGVGFVSGLGAATADGFYGAAGAFGLAAVTHFFAALRLCRWPWAGPGCSGGWASRC